MVSFLHQPCQRTSVSSQGQLDVTLILSPTTSLHMWGVDSWWLCSHSACLPGAVLGTRNSEVKEPDNRLILYIGGLKYEIRRMCGWLAQSDLSQGSLRGAEVREASSP